MASMDDRSRLHVEGEDDRHAICHLLIRHGIDYDQRPWPRHFPRIQEIGGKDPLLDGIETAVSVSNGRSIGFCTGRQLVTPGSMERSLVTAQTCRPWIFQARFHTTDS